MWMNVDHVLIPLIQGACIGKIAMKIFFSPPHNTRDGRWIVRSVFHFAHPRDGVTSRGMCVWRPAGYMTNAPLAHAIVAWDLWLRPPDLAPAPLEPPPWQGSQLLDSTSCSCGDSTMPRFEAASLLSTPVLIAYGIFSAVVFVAMLYKAQHEQLDVFMASAWIYQSNGCLLVRRKVVSQ